MREGQRMTRKISRRSCRRVAVCLASALLVLSSCNNFSFSGILDSPPGGALQLLPDTINVPFNGTTQFTAKGGTGSYSYSVAPGGASGPTPINITASGLYTAPSTSGIDTVIVKDSANTTSESTVMVVSSVPLSITPTSTTINAGGSVTFTASGGTTPYTWSSTGTAGSVTGSGTYNELGTFNAQLTNGSDTVRVTDSTLPTPSYSEAAVTVTVPPALFITPASTNVLAASAVTFTGGGGSGSYAFSLVSGTGSLVGSTYTTTIAETSTIRLTDTNTNLFADATVVSYYPLTLVPSTVDVQTSGSNEYAATGGGPGIPGYTYTVAPGSGSFSGAVYTAPASPQINITVQVTDSIGNVSTATVNVFSNLNWTIVSLDTPSRSGQYASLALDSVGVPQIAYYESRNKELRLEKLGVAQTVDSAGTVGQYASLALDAGGNARISYYDATNNHLKYAAWNGSSWAIQVVDAAGNVGKYTSIALDSSGNPHISYYDVGNRQLKYASWSGSTWTRQIVDNTGDEGMYSSLALDTSNNPHIAYYNNTGKHLMYISAAGGVWQPQQPPVDPVANTGTYASLALEPVTGYPHISYYDSTGKVLKHAFWDGSAWTLQTADATVNVGTYSSIAIDAAKNPHIAYYNATTHQLNYISASAGNVWPLPQPPVDTTNNAGTYASLRLHPTTGLARIAYYYSIGQDLRYASQ
jgi:hypothetical protein